MVKLTGHPWNRTSFTKLSDFYIELDIENSHQTDLQNVTDALKIWEYINTESFPSTAQYEVFMNDCVDTDPSVQRINQEKKRVVAEQFPEIAVKEIDQWLHRAWNWWLKQKVKWLRQRCRGQGTKITSPLPSQPTLQSMTQSQSITLSSADDFNDVSGKVSDQPQVRKRANSEGSPEPSRRVRPRAIESTKETEYLESLSHVQPLPDKQMDPTVRKMLLHFVQDGTITVCQLQTFLEELTKDSEFGNTEIIQPAHEPTTTHGTVYGRDKLTPALPMLPISVDLPLPDTNVSDLPSCKSNDRTGSYSSRRPSQPDTPEVSHSSELMEVDSPFNPSCEHSQAISSQPETVIQLDDMETATAEITDAVPLMLGSSSTGPVPHGDVDLSNMGKHGFWKSVNDREVIDLTTVEHVEMSEVNEMEFDPNAIPAADFAKFQEEQEEDPDEVHLDLPVASTTEDSFAAIPGESEQDTAQRILALKIQLGAMAGRDLEHLELRDEWDPKWTPPLLNDQKLTPWQELGVTWMEGCRREYGFGLLGDEMGIGKTLQALSFLWLEIKRSTTMVRQDRRQCVIVCPLVLVSQWIDQSRQFFSKDEMVLIRFDPITWLNSLDCSVVWVVSESRLSLFSQTLPVDISIPALIADESHQYLRSSSAARVKGWKELMDLADFICLLSGTFFPLGPREDYHNTLVHLGGPLDESGKWDLKTLNMLKSLQKNWNVLALRTCIRPFFLRRTKESKWDNEFIIPRTIKAPVPFIEDPQDPRDTEYYREGFKLVQELDHTKNASLSLFTSRRGIPVAIHSSRAMSQRAATARMLAWSQCWAKWAKTESQFFPDAKTKQQALTALIKHKFPRSRPRPRVIKLCSLLKMIKNRGERFLIVSDRIFLLSIAYLVCREMKLEVGFLTGQNILDRKVSEITKIEDIKALNRPEPKRPTKRQLADQAKESAAQRKVRERDERVIDGILMTDKTGGTGHNLHGANHIIFLGSLYSADYEKQAIGRIARKGQMNIPKAYIIASESFPGDREALQKKRDRGEDAEGFRKEMGALEFAICEDLFRDTEEQNKHGIPNVQDVQGEDTGYKGHLNENRSILIE